MVNVLLVSSLQVSEGVIPTDALILLLKGYVECIVAMKPSMNIVNNINSNIFSALARQLKLHIKQRAVFTADGVLQVQFKFVYTVNSHIQGQGFQSYFSVKLEKIECLATLSFNIIFLFKKKRPNRSCVTFRKLKWNFSILRF